MIGAMAWILDLDGVVWRGDQPIAGSAEAIARLRASGEDVGFVTNFSYSPVETVEAKLAGFGIEARGAVTTSAQAAAGLLEPGERALLVAGPGVRQALEQRGVEVVADGDADAVVVGWHPEFTYDRMAAAMRAVGPRRPPRRDQRRRHPADAGRRAARRGRDPGVDRAGHGRDGRGGRQAVRTVGGGTLGAVRPRGHDGRRPARHRRPLRRRARLSLGARAERGGDVGRRRPAARRRGAHAGRPGGGRRPPDAARRGCRPHHRAVCELLQAHC